MKSRVSYFLVWAVVATLSLLARSAQAGEGVLDLSQKTLRGSAIVETWGLPAADSCRMPSILGLCGTRDGVRTNLASRKSNRALFGWGSLRSLSIDLTRFNVKKAAPNKLFQLVKMFIDDLEVAQIGDFKIKVAISLE